MNFIDYATKRQSVREFKQASVERDDILYCIEAARLAPSSFNMQPWKFIVVDDPAVRGKIASAVCNPILKTNMFVKNAPVLVVLVNDVGNGLNMRMKTMVRKFNLTPYDIGFAAQNFCLAATDRGLGTCVVGWFKQSRIKDILFIPDDREVSLVIAVGYAEDDGTREKDRKALESIYSFNTYE